MSWFRRRAVPKEPPKLLPQRTRSPLPEKIMNESINTNNSQENHTNRPDRNKERN